MSMGDKVYTDKEVVVSRTPSFIYLADTDDAIIENDDNSITYVDMTSGLDTITVPEPSDGNVGGRIGQRSYRCVICGFAYKERDTVIFRGKPYGKPCGCYKDIQSILLSERANRQRHTANESRDRR